MARLTVVTSFVRAPALVLAAALTVSCGRTAAQYLDSGNRYFDAKRYQEAIVEYLNAVQQDLVRNLEGVNHRRLLVPERQ